MKLIRYVLVLQYPKRTVNKLVWGYNKSHAVTKYTNAAYDNIASRKSKGTFNPNNLATIVEVYEGKVRK